MANHDDRSAVRVTKMRVAGIFISSATIRGSLVLRIAGDVVKGRALYAPAAACKAVLAKIPYAVAIFTPENAMPFPPALLELAALSATEDESSIAALCLQATDCAAVCVPPPFVAQARRALPAAVQVASVVNFPDGAQSQEAIYATLRQILADGGDEIAFVFPYRAFINDNASSALELSEGVAQFCHDHDTRLRVILETGVLADGDILASAEAAIRAGADMLQTSSGYAEKGATPEAALLLLNTLAAAPRDIGLVIAGGVHDADTARAYLVQAAAVMGEDWPDAVRFRLSMGAEDLLALQDADGQPPCAS